MEVTLRVLRGAEMTGWLPDLARLRIAVFRDFPYLYDGDLTYETRYLARYACAPRSMLVAAFAGDDMVGAATAMPLEAHDDAGAVHLPPGTPPARDIYYCAESVLLQQARGRGVGHRFFDLREAEARAAGFGHCGFVAVTRAEDHPLRPGDYRPLDPFWRKRGYAPVQGAVAEFSWTDLGAARETPKELQLWLRGL